jgi:fatty-acid desaturase
MCLQNSHKAKIIETAPEHKENARINRQTKTHTNEIIIEGIIIIIIIIINFTLPLLLKYVCIRFLIILLWEVARIIFLTNNINAVLKTV